MCSSVFMTTANKPLFKNFRHIVILKLNDHILYFFEKEHTMDELLLLYPFQKSKFSYPQKEVRK